MKTNYLSVAMKILLFAAAIIITCIIVMLGFRAADTAKEISNSAVIQMTELNNDIKDNDIKKYHNIEVYGSDVVNCIKKNLGDYTSTEIAPLYIFVKTSVSENTYTNGAYITNIRDLTHNMYIKPTAVFLGTVIVNENKVIIGISFIQK